MNEKGGNIYKSARLSAGLKREPAAEELYIDVRTLDKYEASERKPSDETVAKMCQLYECPYLAYQHLKGSALGEFLPEVSESGFQAATLNVLNDFHRLQGDLQDVIRIASDGKVDDDQIDDWNDCVSTLQDLAGSLINLIFSAGGSK